jgi:hypothetical protein
LCFSFITAWKALEPEKVKKEPRQPEVPQRQMASRNSFSDSVTEA